MKNFFERIEDIKKTPDCFTDKDRGDSHESILKSYRIVDLVLEMLREKMDSEHIIQTIYECKKSKCKIENCRNGKVFSEHFSQMVPCQNCCPEKYIEFLKLQSGC